LEGKRPVDSMILEGEATAFLYNVPNIE
jgi:hypothetical protein